MTFEEFLIKKKIDLALLKAAEPVLASEFESHYRQMGEKSFDHSKKFLFNKLRRAYHIKEEPKPAVAKEVIKVNELASQAEPLLSPSVEATVYTPRFKPAGATPPAKPQENIVSTPAEQAKPAFKPRFKPGLTNTTPEAGPVEESVKEEKIEAETPKPAYQPRFKAAITPLTGTDPDIINTIPAEQSKPAFKPRFKPGITNAPPIDPTPEPEEEDKEEMPKPAYKPRFKPSIVKQKDENNDPEL